MNGSALPAIVNGENEVVTPQTVVVAVSTLVVMSFHSPPS